MKEKRYWQCRCGNWIYKDNLRCFDCGGKKYRNSRRSNNAHPKY